MLLNAEEAFDPSLSTGSPERFPPMLGEGEEVGCLGKATWTPEPVPLGLGESDESAGPATDIMDSESTSSQLVQPHMEVSHEVMNGQVKREIGLKDLEAHIKLAS